MSKTIAVACFFNADHESLGGYYGPPCNSRVVQGLEALSSPAITHILRGDLNPHLLVYKISSVAVEEKFGTRMISRKESPDMELYEVILCDLAESLGTHFSTIEEQSFLFDLARHNIWTVVLTAIAKPHAIEIDNKLKLFDPYLGASQIDTGNPVHMRLFSLLDGAFFKKGSLFYRSEWEKDGEDRDEEIHVAKSYGASTEPILLNIDEFASAAPPPLVSTAISERGRLSVNRLEGKSKLAHKQKVAQCMLEYFESNPDVNSVEFITNIEKDSTEFICEKNKVRNYLLNPDHKDGRSKAKFFTEVLGIEREDWRYLSDQIIQGMKDAILFRFEDTSYGLQHRAFLMVTGRNGKFAVLNTGWEIRKGKRARFLTAYPEKKYAEEEFTPNPDNVVSPLLTGDKRWSAIYDRAHAAGLKAAKATVPTPMIIKGFPTVFEGACGFAWVVVTDARTGMVRWLRKNKIGHKNYGSGYCISASFKVGELVYGDTQSIEPKEAYAKTFAEILKANGVECRVESRLD